MRQQLDGAVVLTAADEDVMEYLPNRGVFMAQLLGRDRGHAFGFYRGTMAPGCEISRELHTETTETIYILAGHALGIVGDREVPLGPGQMMHVETNVHHGLRNTGAGPLEFLVIGHPDF
ncbi:MULTISPECIES: cupin domain-containing protein [Sorangium]|uniref:Cupin domain-containing protein n=1 Tax=Sorangium atrum TaxID=2995308 RepID=A0ABT5C332_9BACT|nr:cupin domain-containing protein [Sorangium aterium]MDC0680388.1 cupin domain-containing protein [Sorangium aterium]